MGEQLDPRVLECFLFFPFKTDIDIEGGSESNGLTASSVADNGATTGELNPD